MNYTIEGAPMPVVICNLEGGETMLTEKGAMSWMSPNMKMETTTGGGIGKMFGRAFSGESMFINRYTAQGGTGLIAFASSFPVRMCVRSPNLTKLLMLPPPSYRKVLICRSVQRRPQTAPAQRLEELQSAIR